MDWIYEKIYKEEFNRLQDRYWELLEECEKWNFGVGIVDKNKSPELFYIFRKMSYRCILFRVIYFYTKKKILIHRDTIRFYCQMEDAKKARNIEKAVEDFKVDTNYTWHLKP